MNEQPYAVTDPATLRALAHPLRQRIMWELAARDYLRATDLAKICGEPANSVSFHLRSLARAGLIEEKPEQARDSRDRVWGMTHPEGVHFPQADIATNALLAERLDWVKGLLDETLPRDPHAARTQYLGAAVLTRDEALTMAEEVMAVFEKWRERGSKAAIEHPHDPDRVLHFTAAFVGNPRVCEQPSPVQEVHDLGSSVADDPA
ncbi:Helix-turn-helix domain-containing protein [Paramicrobacterium humi]|uniref:Helix-turn-helix domain-containing protein n=1 Tax=Paramicrobacterium humi TaxID=640635 RepID=A0A1H4T8E2_9MICO|nr:helix-turn-helix domain-containing protein [Microbacterium humi]SEC52706.1 Helix-turn-helix domain-containing protein [Microbacterium humi]